MKNRILGLTFSFASLAMCAMVLLYIVVLAPGVPEGAWASKMEYLESNWRLYSMHWRIEFLAVAATAFTSLYFAKRNVMWLLVAVGHLFYLTEYPLMIAGYLEAGNENGFTMLNEMAMFIFFAANLLWLLGMLGVYMGESGWLRVVGAGLSGIAGLASLALFLEIIGVRQAAAAGIPVLALYLLNAWYGLMVLSRSNEDMAGSS